MNRKNLKSKDNSKTFFAQVPASTSGQENVLGNPAGYSGNFAKDYTKVLRKLTAFIAGKIAPDYSTAEFLAAKAALYVITPALDGKGKFPATTEDWYKMGCGKASRLVIDAFRAQSRSKVIYTLDTPVVGEDGSIMEEPLCVTRASYEAWRTQEADATRAEFARRVYGYLSQLFAGCGISKDAGALFKEFHLEKAPLDYVMRKYHVTASNVYVTIFRVKRLLRKMGTSVCGELGLAA